MISRKKEPLAIIGIGCRFPGNSNSPEEFWRMICEKTDCIVDIPADRWDADAFYAPEFDRPGKINVRRGGFIEDIDKFDARFFGISPIEASRMDPQQRMLLEVSYEAIEDAGLCLDDLANSRTAVFIGIATCDYGNIQASSTERANIDAHTNLGVASCINANRISYVYNLKGPSFSVDTACSSSLNAIHLACKSIWDGEADLAFAGGTNVILRPETQMGFSRGGFLSPDGTCFSFGSRANGYVRSEGAGLIIVKPLSQARQDKDFVYAVIKGSAVNQDGTTKGIAVPNPVAQQNVLNEAYRDAGVDPHKVQYIEAHGTGTSVGDPIEANAIGRAIGTNREDICFVGSIKSNIGHLEAASGVAGIIKLALALRHKIIPPNINFQKGNPEIAFDELRLRVPTEVTEWSSKDGYFGGVNSFGFGGSNVHIVLEGLPEESSERKPDSDRDLQICCISARNDVALRQLAASYITFLEDNEASFDDICYSTCVRRTHHDYRLAIVANSKEELVERLQLYLYGEILNEVASGRANRVKDKIVFVFSGQGAQWWAMGRQLFECEPLFRKKIHEVDKLFSKYADWSLIEELTKDEESSRINETNITQPATFALQIALYEMWKAAGITPAAVVGHSVGEVAASYVSGALTLGQAVLLIFHRSRIQYKARDKGRMLAAGISVSEAEEAIKGLEDKVSIAAINGPAMVALSGDTDAIEQIAEALDKKDVFHRLLQINVPFHSRHMEPLRDEILTSLASLEPTVTRIPLYSTVTGGVLDGRRLDSEHWWRNVREPVQFMGTVERLIDDGFDTFIELGPHPIHAIGINGLLANKKKEAMVVPSLMRKEDEKRTFLSSLAALHAWGCKVDWKAFYGEAANLVSLPKYPWQKERYWLETEEGMEQRIGTFWHPHLTQKVVSARESNNILWHVTLDKRTYPYIEDHRIQGPIVFPGAGHVDLAISAALASFGDRFGFLEDINFEYPLFLPDSGEPPHVQMDISHDGGDYFIYTKPRGKDDAWTMCSNGKMNHIADRFSPIEVNLSEIKERVNIPVAFKAVDDVLQESGLYLGPSFRGIRELWRSDGARETLGQIEVPEEIRPEFFQFSLHPAVLDSCFQTLCGVLVEENKAGLYIPVHIDKVKLYRKPDSCRMYVYSRLRERTDEYIRGNIWLFGEDEKPIAEFHGFQAKYLKGSRGEVELESERWFYEYNWRLKHRIDQEQFRNPGEYLPSPNAIGGRIQGTIDELAEHPNKAEYYGKFELELNKICVEYICRSLREMGLTFDVGTRISVEQLIKKFGVAEKHHRLFNQMFRILWDDGILQGDEGTYEITRVPEAKDSNVWIDELKQKFPQFHHESSLLGRCGPELARVLTGDVDPIQLLFPEEDWASTIEFYSDSFSCREYNTIAARAVSELLRDVPEDQTIRILEIGAGTGGVTQAILPLLPPERTEYCYTDISHMFFLKAAERFAKYPFIQYKTLDIEKEPATQGIRNNSFDIVFASNVIHATRNIKATLNNIQSLLASEGILLMLEATNAPIYADLTFGMTEGWWLFEDTDIRPDHPIMSANKWRAVLEDVGYSDIAIYSDVKEDERTCQSVILARSRRLDLNNKVIEELPQPDEADWLIFADNAGVADRIRGSLSALGKQCHLVRHGSGFRRVNDTEFEIDPLAQKDVDALFDLLAQRGEFQGIIFLWGLDSVDNDHADAESIVSSETHSSVMMINIMRKLNEIHFDTPPEMWIVTSGAQSVSVLPETIQLSQSGLRGVGRTIISEFASFDTTMIDFSCPVQDEEINAFIDEILAGDKEDEIAFRGKRRYINKLERISPESIAQRARKSVPAAGSNYTTTIADQDMLDNFVIRETVCPMPGDDEIKVEVKAASLNFRDIMLGMGLLSDAAAEGGLLGKSLGADCAGVVTAVGKNVKDVKIGDEILGIASSCFSGSTILKVSHVAQKPENISFEQAASLPVVYSTAHYALMHLCRMQEGDRVLIHSASGGVGTAAVRIAHAVGAEVYATVSNQEKRDYVESMGVSPEHIFDSRTLEFAHGIMESTKGKGIDIVLNTLSGEAIYKSIRCLAPLGRFVDLTKTDIYRNSKLGLRPFRNNLSYFAVDLDRLCIQKERYSGMLFREAMDFFFQNDLPFHPIQVFPISQIGDAFQLMARSRHIGKIVISMTGDVQMAPPEEIRFKEDGTYMITGGCSGFGLAVANWMTKKGARHLVLMSRSGPKTDEDEKVIEEMKGRNVQVVIAKGDVSAKEDVNRIVADIKKNMPALKGIQHAAMVLDDGIIPDMDCERYMKVFKPKAIGCWLLHEATRDMDLDHFVLHSSLCSIIGNPGQVNYVAASHFLDSFSYFRRAQGLPSIAINWGVLGDIGYIARNREIGKLLSRRGWRMFSLKQSTDILEQVLLTNPVQIVASDLDWQLLGESLPHFSQTGRFSHLAREEMAFSPGRDSGPANLKAELLQLSHQERLDILTEQIRDIFAKVLGTTTDSLDTTEPVTRYGLDSLMAGQISNWIHRKVSIDYKMMRILEGPTLEEMARDISQEFDEQVGISGQGVYELDKCIIRTRKVRKPGLRLFCFPYFGGDASVYGNWHKSLPDNIEVCAIQYPGREERSNEKPFNDISELTRMTAEVIEPLLDCPIAFYGHSFGAAHAFELTRYLREKNGIQPVVFIVGAWRAQHLGIPPEFMEAASIIDSIDEDGICKDENISRIIYQLRTIGFPESVLDHTLRVLGNRGLTDEILPAIRADIPLIKRYRYRESEPFSCPIVAIAGRNDTIVSEEEVEQWKKHTTGEFHFSTVNAGHLFCIDSRGELPGLIAKELNELGMLHLQNPQPIASFQHLGG